MSSEVRALHTEAHKQFIKNHDKDKAEDFGYWLFEHLQVSGFYWGLSAMALFSALEEMPKDEILGFVSKCFDESSGGFGGSIGHDPHLLYTLSAVQVYALFESLDLLNKDAIAKFVASMQKDDGSFSGDEWGEIDTRFSYIALNCLSLLGRLDAIDMDKAVDFVVKCINFDGGFGVIPGAESHAGQTFCCVGALAIAGKLDRIDLDLLGWWLCERQLPNGGLNGRPQKLPDVCYSWWVLSCLGAIDRLHWMSCPKLTEFILDCQDPDRGGISDRPDDRTDVYHTFFGLSGLSLMGYKGLVKIDPVYALPAPLTQKLGLQNAKMV